MAEEINLNKEVFNKRAYLKTIDTSFKELGVPTIQEQITAQPSVQEFFDLYNTLFYNINEFGPTNSHEFLIKTSQEYIGFEEENEIIELSKFIGSKINDIPNKIKELNFRLKAYQERLKKIEQKQNENLILDLKKDFKKINEMNVLIKRIDGINLSNLRGLIDSLKHSIGEAIIVLSGEFQSKAMIIVSVSKDMSDTIDARKLLESCSKLIDAKGGGKEDFAQAGGGDPKKIDLALTEANNFLN